MFLLLAHCILYIYEMKSNDAVYVLIRAFYPLYHIGQISNNNNNDSNNNIDENNMKIMKK